MQTTHEPRRGTIPPTHPSACSHRSLKLFFVLRMYGAEKMRTYISHHIALASHFAARVSADPRFEIAAPPRFGLVCFRWVQTCVRWCRLQTALHHGYQLVQTPSQLGNTAPACTVPVSTKFCCPKASQR